MQPRLVIHGGAGNIQTRENYPKDKYEIYRTALLSIVRYSHRLLTVV